VSIIEGRAIAITEHGLPAAPQSEAGAIIHMIERAARDPSVDIDKLRQLMELREKVETRAAEKAFDNAMSAAQAEMRPVAADCNNPQTRSRYASYLALDKALRPIYTRNGFSLSFNTGTDAPEGHVRVLCRVAHSGIGRDYHIDMPADGKGAKGGDVMTKTHATGSAVSYGMRYLLKMIFNISVGEDDDGNAAGDDGERISKTQLAALIELADEVGADKAKFCRYMKVQGLAEIQARDYQRAVAALEAKRGRS
jgi:hypothetical protein